MLDMSGNGVEEGEDSSETVETYQDWLDIIEQLRKENDSTALNQAYESFSQNYFLPPEIWLQWVEDEKQRLIAQDRQVAFTRVLEIVERALKETLYSAELWLLLVDLLVELVNFGKLSEEVVRERLEQAVTHVALDFRQGWQVFEKYWQFEDKYGNKDNANNLKMRCASLPFERYPQVLLETTDEEIRERIEKNETKREERFKYEESVSKAVEVEEIVNAWKLYAEFETSVDLMRAKMIYERAVRSCYHIPDLWLAYLGFLFEKFPSSNVNVEVSRKAFSCVSNSVEIAKYAMRAQERSAEGFHGVSDVFWKAWSVMSVSSEHLVELSFCYLHCLRRLYTAGKLEKKYLSEILRDFQKTFDNDVLASADPSCQILRFIATCFQVILKESIENIRSVWEQMLRKQGKLASTWLHYIQWEVNQQQYENARRLFRRGIHTLVEQVDILAKEWIGFEGLYGDVSQYEKALKVTNERRKFCERISRQPSLSANLSHLQREEYRNKPKRVKTSKENADNAGTSAFPAKLSQTVGNTDKKWHKDLHTIFVSNLPKVTTQEDFQSLFSSISGFLEARLVLDKEGVPKGFGYVEFQNDASVKEALKADQTIFLGQKIVVRRSKPPKLQKYSTPSRRIGIGIGFRHEKMETSQATQQDSDQFEEASSEKINKTSWTQDDFRRWIQKSSVE